MQGHSQLQKQQCMKHAASTQQEVHCDVWHSRGEQWLQHGCSHNLADHSTAQHSTEHTQTSLPIFAHLTNGDPKSSHRWVSTIRRQGVTSRASGTNHAELLMILYTIWYINQVADVAV